MFIDQETGLRGFQLTGDAVMLDPWKSAAGPIQIRFATLRDLVAGDGAQLRSVNELDSRYNEWLGFANAVLNQDAAALKAAGLNQRGKRASIRGSRAFSIKIPTGFEIAR